MLKKLSRKCFRFLLIVGAIFILVNIGALLASWSKPPFGDSYQKDTAYLKRKLKRVRNHYATNGIASTLKMSADIFTPETDDALDRIYTGLHALDLYYFDMSDALHKFSEGYRAGGYFDFLSEQQLIVVSGNGQVSLMESEDGTTHKIASNLPEILKENKHTLLFAGLDQSSRFTIKDIYYDKADNRIYASYLVKQKESVCFALQVAQASLNSTFLTPPYKDNLNFSPFFTTHECASKFDALETGGRITRLNDKLAVTIGSMSQNDETTPPVPQDPNSHLGKILLIDSDGTAEVYSMGHRNPQGLTVRGNQLFSSEHGPMGGDEVNIIKKAHHYGWNKASYGFTYQTDDIYQRPHGSNFEEPAFYFTPSIGISEIRFVTGSMFPRWKDSLLVASLAMGTLYRLQYEPINQRFITAEAIKIGHRIRDIQVATNGAIWLLTDDQLIIKISRGDSDILLPGEVDEDENED